MSESSPGPRRRIATALLLVAVSACALVFYQDAWRDRRPIQRWTRLARSRDVNDRRTAISALGVVPIEEIEESTTVLAAAVHDPDVAVRRLAVTWLCINLSYTSRARERRPGPINAADPTPAARRAVEDALMVALTDHEPEIRTFAVPGVCILARSSSRAQGAILESLHDPEVWGPVFLFMDPALGARPDVLPIVLAALHDPRSEVRLQAVRLLIRSKVDVTESMPVLLPLLHDPSDLVRDSVASGLGDGSESSYDFHWRWNEVLPPILELVTAPDPSIRWTAIAALGRYAGPRAGEVVDVLAGAVKDQNGRVRSNAVHSLAHLTEQRIGGEQPFALLVQSLEGPDENLTRDAVGAVARLMLPRADLAAVVKRAHLSPDTRRMIEARLEELRTAERAQ